MGAGHSVMDDMFTYLVTGADSVFGIGIPCIVRELVGVVFHVCSFTIKKKCGSLDISGRIASNR